MDKQKQKILIKSHIGRGKENSISRYKLFVLTNIGQNRIRELIREMRYVDHEIICSTDNDTVYFYPNGVGDTINYLNEIMKKHKQVMEYIQHLQKRIETDTGGVINYKNLPDIDIDYERERRSTEEIF